MGLYHWTGYSNVREHNLPGTPRHDSLITGYLWHLYIYAILMLENRQPLQQLLPAAQTGANVPCFQLQPPC